MASHLIHQRLVCYRLYSFTTGRFCYAGVNLTGYHPPGIPGLLHRNVCPVPGLLHRNVCPAPGLLHNRELPGVGPVNDDVLGPGIGINCLSNTKIFNTVTWA